MRGFSAYANYMLLGSGPVGDDDLLWLRCVDGSGGYGRDSIGSNRVPMALVMLIMLLWFVD